MVGRFSWALVLCLLFACGGTDDARGVRSGSDAQVDGGKAGDAGSDSSSEAGSNDARAFRLAVAGAQLLVGGPNVGLQLTPANLASDADVFAIHQEFYGIPWAAFETGTPAPPEWVALLASLASSAETARKPVFLSISMLNGMRERLAATTRIENGAVKSDDTTSAPCYDFSSASDRVAKRSAYLKYAEFMVDQFRPAYLNIAIEINVFFEKCAAAAPALIEVINATYDRIKAKSPTTLVFPSFQIDHLYGYATDGCPDPSQRAACFNAHYAQLATIKRDRFAISTYPYLADFERPGDLPADWFVRGASRGHERALIAETGWLATPLVARARTGECATVLSASENDSAEYLARVLADADTQNLELVTWWSDRDLLPVPMMTSCPCNYSAVWCDVLDAFRGPATSGSTDTQFFGEIALKAFATMGLRSYDGTWRAQHQASWLRAKARPLAPNYSRAELK